jgi:hypothetical protein
MHIGLLHHTLNLFDIRVQVCCTHMTDTYRRTAGSSTCAPVAGVVYDTAGDYLQVAPWPEDWGASTHQLDTDDDHPFAISMFGVSCARQTRKGLLYVS